MPEFPPSHVLYWCDDLLVFSHHLTAWVANYVDLEESLAVGSISQELLAHASALLGVAGFSPLDRDEYVFARAADRWMPSGLVVRQSQDWPDLVARSVLFGMSLLVLRDHLVLPQRPAVQRLAQVIEDEVVSHTRHWKRWVTLLGRDPELRRILQDRLSSALADSADLFGGGPEGSDSELLPASRLPTMHEQWAGAVRKYLHEVGLDSGAIPAREPFRRPRPDELTPLLAQVQSERGPNGERSYTVYK